MKKILMITLAILLTAALAAGCNKPAAPAGEQPSDELSENAGEASDTPDESATPNILFGKVSNIVGNEIELEIASLPAMDMDEAGGEGPVGNGSVSIGEDGEITHYASPGAGGGHEGDAVEEQSLSIEDGVATGADSGPSNSSQGAPTGGEADAPTVAGAIQNPDGTVRYFGFGGEDGGTELEYTGESATIIIPAGADIESLVGGEATLDAIKKGSVVMVNVPDMDATPLTASSISIVE